MKPGKVILIGNLGRDPDVSYSSGGSYEPKKISCAIVKILQRVGQDATQEARKLIDKATNIVKLLANMYAGEFYMPMRVIGAMAQRDGPVKFYKFYIENVREWFALKRMRRPKPPPVRK